MKIFVWNTSMHPLTSVARDEDGAIWINIAHHPLGAAQGRLRMRASAEPSIPRSGTAFVRLDWIESEFDHAMDEATERFDTRKVIALSNRKIIGLRVCRKMAPKRFTYVARSAPSAHIHTSG